MSDRETGVEEARKVLGQLVDDAALEGAVTYLTRRGRRYAALVPLDRIKETAVTTTYTAAIVTAASDVEGDFCDVTVAENVIATYREDEDGNEIPEYMMGDKIMMPAQETTVRIDDEDPWGRLEEEAEQLLAENGWRVTGKWELSDNAAYAPVELA